MGSLDHYYNVLANMGARLNAVAFGDSNTELLYITEQYHNWVGWFSVGLFGAGAYGRKRIMNSGVAGSTATGSLDRIDSDVLFYQPDIVIIEFGTNDQVQYPASKTKKSMQEMITRIQTGNPTTSILMRTPPPLYQATPDGKGEWITTNTNMNETVQAIRDVACDNQIELVDHYKLWQEPNQPHPPSFYMWDIYHASYNGHRRFYYDMQSILKLPVNPLTPPSAASPEKDVPVT